MRKFTKESTTHFVKGPVCRWNVQKMQSESSEYVRKTTGFFTDSCRIKMALESYFEEHAQEVWERNWMNIEMQTTLLNTCPPTLTATILKALREQVEENENAVKKIAGPAPNIPLEYDQILKGGGKFWDDVKGGYLPEDLVLAARREEIDWVHSEGVYEIVPMQECRDAGMRPLDLIWVDTDKSVDPTRKKIRSRLCAREYKTKKQGKIQRALPASQLFSAMPPLAAVNVLVSIMMSVSLSNKGKPMKLRHYDISRAHFQGTAQRPIYIKLPEEDRQKYGEDEVGRLVKSMYGTQDASHIWELDYVNLICGELGGFRRGKHSAALFHNPNQDVRTTVHGDDIVCLSDDDGLKHIDDSLLKSKAKDMGTLGFEDSDVKSLLLLNRVFRVGVDQTGQYLDIELDLRHAPLIISESGCVTNTKVVSTPREKLQDKLVLDGRRSPILKKEEATRYRSACMRLSYLVLEKLELAETAKHLAQRMSEPREFDFIPLKRAARYLVGMPKAALRFRRQKHVDTITVFVDSDFAGDRSLEKEHDGIGGSDRKSHCEIWIDASERDSIERWRSGVSPSGQRRSSWTIPDLCTKIWEFQ